MDKNLKDDIELAYNAQMVNLYKKYGKEMSSIDIKIEYFKWITNHILSSLQKELTKKTNPMAKLNKILKIVEGKKANTIPDSPAEEWKMEELL